MNQKSMFVLRPLSMNMARSRVMTRLGGGLSLDHISELTIVISFLFNMRKRCYRGDNEALSSSMMYTSIHGWNKTS